MAKPKPIPVRKRKTVPHTLTRRTARIIQADKVEVSGEVLILPVGFMIRRAA
ncbi:MAG: hypothetical protein ABI577_10075 [bacterium]